MPQVSSEGVRLTDTDCIEGIIDTMSDPLVLVDENGRLLDANPAFFQMVGEEYSVLSERELNTLFVDSKGVCEGERAVVGKTGEVTGVPTFNRINSIGY